MSLFQHQEPQLLHWPLCCRLLWMLQTLGSLLVLMQALLTLPFHQLPAKLNLVVLSLLHAAAAAVAALGGHVALVTAIPAFVAAAAELTGCKDSDSSTITSRPAKLGIDAWTPAEHGKTQIARNVNDSVLCL